MTTLDYDLLAWLHAEARWRLSQYDGFVECAAPEGCLHHVVLVKHAVGKPRCPYCLMDNQRKAVRR